MNEKSTNFLEINNKRLKDWKDLLEGYLNKTPVGHLLKKISPDSSIIDDLIEDWRYPCPDDKGKTLEAKMVELVKGVSEDNVPDWFFNLLLPKRHPIPPFLEECVKNKAQDLLLFCSYD